MNHLPQTFSREGYECYMNPLPNKDTYYERNRKELCEQSRKRNFLIKKQLYARLGGNCTKCGFSDMRALQVDHVNGGGTKELKKLEYRYEKYYQYLLSLPLKELKSKYQLLCANCNWIKRAENNENIRVKDHA
jgi:hypothetical protein